jgi:hypothetical protein
VLWVLSPLSFSVRCSALDNWKRELHQISNTQNTTSSLTHGGEGSLLLQHPWVYWYDNHCFWIVTNFRVFHNNRNNIQNFPISRIEQIMKDMIRLVYIYKYSWYADKLKWWQSADFNLYEIFLLVGLNRLWKIWSDYCTCINILFYSWYADELKWWMSADMSKYSWYADESKWWTSADMSKYSWYADELKWWMSADEMNNLQTKGIYTIC